jgi:hypothetical protein
MWFKGSYDKSGEAGREYGPGKNIRVLLEKVEVSRFSANGSWLAGPGQCRPGLFVYKAERSVKTSPPGWFINPVEGSSGRV